jgi:hypothetical protein
MALSTAQSLMSSGRSVLPIGKIDKVKVHVEINLFATETGAELVCTISSPEVPIYPLGSCELALDPVEAKTVESVVNAVVEIRDWIKGLTYCNLTGQLTSHPSEGADKEFWCDAFCSVCYEKTLTELPCEHPLCYICFVKIGTSCPCCRQPHDKVLKNPLKEEGIL